jgi:hypothetical protein
MKRLQFIKSLLGTAVASILPAPVVANPEEKKFAHDDIFYQPYSNEKLIYFRSDSQVYKMLENRLKYRIVDGAKFRCYLPKHAFTLLRKAEYTISDFEPLVAMLHGYYERNDKYALYEKSTFLRMIYQKENDSYYPDLFLAQI